MKIHDLAASGDLEGVRRELEQGVQVDVADDEGYTPLARATKSWQVELPMLELLLEAGADVNHRDDNGYSPLLNLSHCPHDSEHLLPMVELLVRHGADVNFASKYGELPLIVAYQGCQWGVFQFLLEHGADLRPLQWTELMREIVLGDQETAKRLLAEPGAMGCRDRYERNPWLLSVWSGRLEMAQLVYEIGVDVDQRGWCGATALMSAATTGDAAMLRWLIELGADLELVDEFGQTALVMASSSGSADCVQALLVGGADPAHAEGHSEKPIVAAISTDVVRLLVGAGEELSEANAEMRRALVGLTPHEKINVSDAEYLAGRERTFGRTNPEVMDVPFWREMVKAGISAYAGKVQFDHDDMMKRVWSFDRFGTTLTALPDGRYVQIGGEHEDFYDPDFCIYNDVVLFDGAGDFTIFGYPAELFPPTDFHSATLVGDVIYIIGSLGYYGSRIYGTTPVYRLCCKSWSIESVVTSGECPGWIHKHRALLVAPDLIVVQGGTIVEIVDEDEAYRENEANYQLDLKSGSWRLHA
ncbi:ankyrin repeat domain-containing protein [Blastopirellula sp. JC732]|uniref:Ankyrin repeat domain-containing protein n=1 Tax=Blastopirellula sediminis TaxID=2894196 RepID=A0A9X1SIK0_9BACT|nr:ankyrin repeat domain-containing protein [Blastopirellula sediminis]MCC9604992.1 ankyrin repeat domain-containing protein [Blastopirellula sediminis]MCC9631708.1 ankyrin repeat domain-containing protein [Blastopirellula sediminis]